MKNEDKNRLAEDLDHILEHTRDILEEFRDARLFVTGGTGFFGTWLLETFAWANKKINLKTRLVILTRDYRKFQIKALHLAKNRDFEFITGDIRNFSFPEGSFSHIFHLATEASDALNRDNPLLMLDTIVDGTRHVLDFAVEAGIKNILFTSSGAVYGRQPDDISHIPEEYAGAPDPQNPLSAYGEAKRLAELLCTLYSRQFNLAVKIARCFAFVGPYLPLDIHFAIGNFILNGLKKEKITVKGDGTPLRSYLYVADLMIWLLTIFAKGKNCRPYNVGSENSINIGSLASIVSECINPKQKVIIHGVPVDGKIPPAYVPSTLRASEELGLKQIIGLKVGIQRTIDCY